jgi:hypothetical protein
MADPESSYLRRRDPALWATALAVLALLGILTWPLAAQLGRSLPGNYGDPLFVTWVMGWVNSRITAGAPLYQNATLAATAFQVVS